MININCGYIEIHCPTCSRARKDGMVLEHLVKAEQKLGRPLKKDEVVHHMDRNRSNNDINNLVIFCSQSDHARYHKTNILLFDDSGIAYSPKQYNYCEKCGKIISPQSKLCRMCSNEERPKKSGKLPTKEKLLEEIKTMNFCELGRKYGVSGNAVRKWCKKYELPYKKKDIIEII